MDKVVLKLWENNHSLSEIFQTVAIRMAHVNSNYEQVHQPGKCRDFLGDMMWSRYWKKPVHIYGLKYDFAENPYDTEVTRLSLKFPNKNARDNLFKNISYLHEREDKVGVTRSVVLDTDQTNTLIIEGDTAWQQCVWKLSLYTFYIKLMSYDDPNTPDYPEAGYKEKLTSDVEKRLLANIKSDFNPLSEDLGTNHGCSGFVSITNIYKQKEYYTSDTYDNCTYVMIAKNIFHDVWGG